MSIPETSTKHEADVICMICLHKAGSGVFVYLSTVYKLVHVNCNARICNTKYTEEREDKRCTLGLRWRSKVKDQEQLANPLQAMVVVHELYEVPLYLGWHEIKGVSSNTVYNQQIAATLTECPLTQAFHQLVLYTWHKQVPFLSIYPQSCQEALFVPRPCWPEWYPATLTTGSVISRSPMISVNPSLISSGVLASFRYSSIMRVLADEAWNREEGWTIRFPSEAVLFFYRNFFWAHRQEGRLHDLSSATDHVYL